MNWVNPVLTRELMTSLRARKSFVLQFVFVGTLSLLVYLGWPAGEFRVRGEFVEEEVIAGVMRLSSSEAARVSTGLFNLFAQGALVLIAVLAPAFSAGSITVEKEKRTLDLLRTTPVTSGSIVSGKLMASMLYLVLLLISTAPVLSMCFLLPGQDPSTIPALYLILITVALTFGMIGLTASAFFDRTQSALVITYLFVIPLAALLLAIAIAVPDSLFTMGTAIVFAIFGLLGNLVLYGAVTARMKKPFNPVPKSVDQEDISRQTGLVLVRSQFPDNWLVPSKTDELMPDKANPVREKELRSEVFGQGTLFMRLIIQLSMVLSIVFIPALYGSYFPGTRGPNEWIFVSYLLVFSMLVGPAFSCNAFTLEKERNTLDMLITTLLRPGQIVAGKIYAGIRFSIILTGFLGLSLVIAAIFSPAFGPFRVELIGYLGVILITIIASVLIGTFCSMIFQTTLVSMVATYSTVLVLFLGPLVVERIMYKFTEIAEGTYVWYTFTCPITAAMSVNQWEAGAKILDEGALPPVWIGFAAFYVALSLLLLGGLHLGVKRMLRL